MTSFFKQVLSKFEVELADLSRCRVNYNEGNSIKIKEEIIRRVLNQLDQFEASKGFLDAMLTMKSLANDFKTNTTYLSRIINDEKGRKFTDYINELRVEYIYEKIIDEDYIVKYNIDGLARKAGFKTTQNFSDVFFKFKGVRPSVFIRELRKKEDGKMSLQK